MHNFYLRLLLHTLSCFPCALRVEGVSVFSTGNLLRGVPEVDECGLAEIGNSKEETYGTQFR
jgi:hypothetical protein